MSMLTRFAALGGGAAQTYVDNVFSTFLYTGTGASQTINNGIDLVGQGGLVWCKRRDSSFDHKLMDTARGAVNELSTNLTTGQVAIGNLDSFNSNGFSLSGGTTLNGSGALGCSWTFRKAAKFFDVVTYTGNGANRTIAHSLGQVPGCIIVKRTDTAADWQVYHRSLANTEYIVLNTTAAAATGATRWNSTTATTTNFSLGTDTTVNANTGTYVAYVFSHDTATDGLIQCGSFTTDGSGNASVTLGWEPQWVMTKISSTTGNWNMVDFMRGNATLSGTAVTAWQLLANTNNAENGGFGFANPTSTGFQASGWGPSLTFIYVAIRRPNKPPTSGTQVFQPTVYTGTNVDNRLVNTTIAPDMVWVRQRDDAVLGGLVVGDRMRGQPYLLTGTTAAEVNDANSFDQVLVSAIEYGTAFSAMNGFYCGNDATAKLNASTTASNQIAEAFKRAPGFFDVVCYTGTGAQLSVTHNLGAVPELIIVKRRDIASPSNGWPVWTGVVDEIMWLNLALSRQTFSNTFPVAPTSSVFTVGTNADNGASGGTYVAYLFASLTGISRVGTYTGNGGTAGTNGTSQTINCGFTAGARFVLVKRTNSTGDWYVFDSARGIVAASDPYLLTNSTAAEVTTVDAVDADNSGFIVNQTSGTNLNVTSASYIFLAVS